MVRQTEWYELLDTIVEVMQEKEITQTQMAKDLEVRQPYLNRVLKRKNAPSVEFVFRVVNYLGIKIGVAK